jgi:hypothetical protein
MSSYDANIMHVEPYGCQKVRVSTAYAFENVIGEHKNMHMEM